MNEENISRIIEYFKINVGQSNTTLINSLRQAGYTDTDIKEAGKRMGLHTNRSIVKRIPMIVTIVIVLLFIVGTSSFAAFTFLKKSKDIQVSPPPASEILPTNSITEAVTSIPSSSDPIEMLKDTLNTKNFKVLVKNTSFTGAGPSTPNSSPTIVRTTLFILDHGKFVRFEDNYPQANQYTIFKGSDFYMIDNQDKKSYHQPLDSSNGQMFYQSAEIVFMPYSLINAINENRITWQEFTESRWKGLWKTNSGDNIIFTAEVDSQNHLPIMISMQSESSTEPYEKYDIEYEEIANVDNYTMLPQDYTLEELE